MPNSEPKSEIYSDSTFKPDHIMTIENLTEAKKGARRILELNVKKGETLSIIGSIDVDPLYYEIFMAVTKDMGIEATLGLMHPRSTYGKPAPRPLEAQAVAADVVLLTPSTSLGHTTTALKALQSGRRAITFPVPEGLGKAVSVLSDQSIYDKAKLDTIKELSMRCAEFLDKGKEVTIKSPLGTDLTVSIEGRTCHNWYGYNDESSHNMTAYPPGDCHISTIEDSARGIVVCDGYVGGMGIPVEPLRFEFKHGKLGGIYGNNKDKQKFERILSESDESARTFAEVGLGTNPWQEAVNSNGDKYIVGSCHIAVGANASPCFGGTNFDGMNFCNLHLDCLMLAPVDVYVDGYRIVGNGKILA
jgi:leucyl aminopeptidase (aminopeptidase T)